MVKRTFWLKKIESAWKAKNIVWLSGIRRVGKTCLCQTLPDVEYFDCELPRIRRMMEDPEAFLENLQGKRIVLDEIHRLENPSELLKIAADHFPNTFIIATGSSTLAASTKFKDTLTGRKKEIWLTPMIMEDVDAFVTGNFNHRLLHGGLPPFFMSPDLPEADFQEWMDAYWAKDIQELFRLNRRYSFQKFFELIMAQSGGIFEATKFAAKCEVSRTTITSYLKVLEITFVAQVIRPFSTHRPTEIVRAPKVYAFDTGFFCYYRGWYSLRSDDMGILWEHFVLNEIIAQLQTRNIYYWRDKQGHEIDFIFMPRGKPPVLIECKWKSQDINKGNLKAFLRFYPEARVFVVCSDVKQSYHKLLAQTKIIFVSLPTLIRELQVDK